jgi:hypothetical protein
MALIARLRFNREHDHLLGILIVEKISPMWKRLATNMHVPISKGCPVVGPNQSELGEQPD